MAVENEGMSGSKAIVRGRQGDSDEVVVTEACKQCNVVESTRHECENGWSGCEGGDGCTPG